MDQIIIDSAANEDKRYNQMKRGMRRWFNRHGFMAYLQHENELLWKYDRHTVELAAQEVLRRAVFGMRITKELQAYILKNDIAGFTEIMGAKELRKVYREMKLEKAAKKAKHA
jgi:hypothetical protein